MGKLLILFSAVLTFTSIAYADKDSPASMDSRHALLITQTFLHLHPGSEKDAKALDDLLHGKKAEFPKDQSIVIEKMSCEVSHVDIANGSCNFYFHGSQKIYSLYGKDVDLITPYLDGDAAMGREFHHAKTITCRIENKVFRAGGGAKCEIVSGEE